MTEQVRVCFEGEGSGVGDLTWGQYDIWPSMQSQGSSFSIGGVLPLQPGTTVQDVAADLRFIVGRHPSLRTRLRLDDDGRACQVLASSGEIPLQVIDAGDAEPAQAAAALHRRWDETIFDYAGEWPIRWGVVGAGGAATHLVSVICHLAADGGGVLALLADLKGRDPVTGLAKGPVRAIQPLEQARLQATPSALRQSEAALRYCERLLRTIPARRFPDSADPRQPRFWQVFLTSPASYLALQVVAARSRASTSTVLLAAWAVVLARVSGRNPAAVQLIVSNRFRPGFADVVSPISQSSLCVIDVADITLGEAVSRAWRSAMGTYKHAYYDSRRRDEPVNRVSRERGEAIDIDCLLNDRRMQSRGEPGSSLPEPAEVRDALPRSTLIWGYQKDQEAERCMLHINNVPGNVQYEFCADTHHVSPADMESCVRGLEAVLVAAALDPASPTGVTE